MINSSQVDISFHGHNLTLATVKKELYIETILYVPYSEEVFKEYCTDVEYFNKLVLIGLSPIDLNQDGISLALLNEHQSKALKYINDNESTFTKSKNAEEVKMLSDLYSDEEIISLQLEALKNPKILSNFISNRKYLFSTKTIDENAISTLPIIFSENCNLFLTYDTKNDKITDIKVYDKSSLPIYSDNKDLILLSDEIIAEVNKQIKISEFIISNKIVNNSCDLPF
jgi:hypothetical protein